jgi:hypothetical protein
MITLTSQAHTQTSTVTNPTTVHPFLPKQITTLDVQVVVLVVEPEQALWLPVAELLQSPPPVKSGHNIMLYYPKNGTIGKGFLTHEDRDAFEFYGYDCVYVISDNAAARAWATRNSLTAISKADAQEILDREVTTWQAKWDSQEHPDSTDERPEIGDIK